MRTARRTAGSLAPPNQSGGNGLVNGLGSIGAFSSCQNSPWKVARGWIGVRLDRDVDWAEIAEICQDPYRVISAGRSAR